MSHEQHTDMSAEVIQLRFIEGEELIAAAPQLAELCGDAFGSPAMASVDSMLHIIKYEPQALVAATDTATIGFLTHRIYNGWADRYLHFSRVIRKGYQRQGLGSRMLAQVIDHHQPSVVGARSQNPAAVASSIRTLRSRGASLVFPFYSEKDREAAQRMAEGHIQAVGSHMPDLRTGLLRRAFDQGRLGDYEIDVRHPDVQVVEDHMQKIRLDRVAGDALFYCARLPQPSKF